jgi:peptidoglycan/LPS O-acetylase OafA/YrhL
VFFVISGYLMMSLVHREILAGDFSIARFYERRVRRIFPALFVMLFATMACGFVVVFPRPFDTLAKTAMAAALFVANIGFWWRTGYFGQTADRMPLLHTWSLSVEEQFYLGFPLLMLVTARKLGGRYATVLGTLAAASFGVSLWSTAFAPWAAFYLLPSRLWELLGGALVALHVPHTAPRPARDSMLAIAGLACIAAATVGYTMTTPFPGAAALLPCVGSALLLGAGALTPTVVHRALGWTPLTWIGTISYSLYLWHWPVLVLARQAVARPLTTAEAACLMALSTGAAALSWKYVEQPFRKPNGVTRRPAIASGAAVGAMLALAMAVVFTRGVPARFDRETRAILAVGGPTVDCRPSRTRISARCARSAILPRSGDPSSSGATRTPPRSCRRWSGPPSHMDWRVSSPGWATALRCWVSSGPAGSIDSARTGTTRWCDTFAPLEFERSFLTPYGRRAWRSSAIPPGAITSRGSTTRRRASIRSTRTAASSSEVCRARSRRFAPTVTTW